MAKSKMTHWPGRAAGLKTILVPVDFSEGSIKALDYAVHLARTFKATLLLLHVAEIYSSGYVPGSVDFPMIEARIRQFAGRSLAAMIRERVPRRVKADYQVIAGWPFGGQRPSVEIVNAAKKLAVDLIVIATQGRRGVDRFLIGSTAERVVRQAPCPVLTVREKRR